jgi:hypothetical protein
MKFIKKRIIVDAECFNPDISADTNVCFELGGTKRTEIMFGPFPIFIDAKGPHLLIPTLEGIMRADPGDWIITGVKGEKYPCKPDIFGMTYERVE